MTHGMILILVTSGMLFLSQAYTERRNDPWFVLRLLADFWRTAFISLQQVVMTLRDISCKGVTCGHLFFFVCVFSTLCAVDLLICCTLMFLSTITSVITSDPLVSRRGAGAPIPIPWPGTRWWGIPPRRGFQALRTSSLHPRGCSSGD